MIATLVTFAFLLFAPYYRVELDDGETLFLFKKEENGRLVYSALASGLGPEEDLGTGFVINSDGLKVSLFIRGDLEDVLLLPSAKYHQAASPLSSLFNKEYALDDLFEKDEGGDLFFPQIGSSPPPLILIGDLFGIAELKAD